MQIDKELLETIQALPVPKVIAVSGFGGSGKSSFAKLLGETIQASVVGVDSFEKPGSYKSVYTLWDMMDFARLEKEVLEPFSKGADSIQYGKFNVKENRISETIPFKNTGTLIVEGVGLFRPDLLKYFTYKIWMDCPLEEATARGKKRDRELGSPVDEFWDGIWKENELQYIEAYKPKDIADILANNS